MTTQPITELDQNITTAPDNSSLPTTEEKTTSAQAFTSEAPWTSTVALWETTEAPWDGTGTGSHSCSTGYGILGSLVVVLTLGLVAVSLLLYLSRYSNGLCMLSCNK